MSRAVAGGMVIVLLVKSAVRARGYWGGFDERAPVTSCKAHHGRRVARGGCEGIFEFRVETFEMKI